MTALPAEQEQAVAELIAEQERRRALWTESHGTWSRQIGDVFVGLQNAVTRTQRLDMAHHFASMECHVRRRRGTHDR